ncbi:MAG: nucleoside triphosphate pyrophosphohydrolase [Bacterioplanes sp.]|nr:nucleoside triphosphate pyrophosphohydrolase [Bacterioplanes sp.]
MTYGLPDLLHLMQRLRDPDTGCPWDRKQTFASIVPHTLEEAYEVADAIAQQDWPHVEDELGDLLFQVVFYAQLGQEQQTFDFTSIMDRLVRKLLRRHPHVFPNGDLTEHAPVPLALTEADIKANWEAIKASEKIDSEDRPGALLDDVPLALPALSRAQKIQKKAASVGFDWSDPKAVFAKIREELDELEAEVLAQDQPRMSDELGDVLFAVTNLARHLNVNAEHALRGTNDRFRQRFAWVEQCAQQAGGWTAMTLTDMEQAWQQAKQQEKRLNATPTDND